MVEADERMKPSASESTHICPWWAHLYHQGGTPCMGIGDGLIRFYLRYKVQLSVHPHGVTGVCGLHQVCSR